MFGAYPDAVMPGTVHGRRGADLHGLRPEVVQGAFHLREYEREAEEAGLDLYGYMNGLAKNIKSAPRVSSSSTTGRGTGTPLTDSEARGAVWGLSLKHTPVHLYRAIMEGIATGRSTSCATSGTRGSSRGRSTRAAARRTATCGCRSTATCSASPYYLTEEPNAPLLGDAVVASYGAGVYRSIEDAAANMVRVRSKIEPDMERREAYRFYVDKYIETYPRLETSCTGCCL